ncbi:hypothetical protein OE88DRAFT_1739725 [Heliocybe sulcata]|uniref:Uncharacterized protein n=1 Tax=Heliocybe sulcata TaxID=5364 RepID=A0A5C3MLB6_9AGAM|nr:hypothetical protein OE88DRAFT_1739725 [Heliocybe sulcata]
MIPVATLPSDIDTSVGGQASEYNFIPPNHFSSFGKLPEDLEPAAVQVTAFAGHYVHWNPKYFDWDAFTSAVAEYAGDHLVGVPMNIEGVKHCLQLGPRDLSLDAVLGWMVDTLTDTLNIHIPRSEIAAPLTNVFKNLEWSNSRGVLSGSNTGWEYRTVYKYAGIPTYSTAW